MFDPSTLWSVVVVVVVVIARAHKELYYPKESNIGCNWWFIRSRTAASSHIRTISGNQRQLARRALCLLLWHVHRVIRSILSPSPVYICAHCVCITYWYVCIYMYESPPAPRVCNELVIRVRRAFQLVWPRERSRVCFKSNEFMQRLRVITAVLFNRCVGAIFYFVENEIYWINFVATKPPFCFFYCFDRKKYTSIGVIMMTVGKLCF